jgi:pimeloyl-ACP methyl ester carboxylesterase
MLKMFRRAMLATLLAVLTVAAVPALAADKDPPIVFVHGNGDTAGLWLTTIWRFESNGYDRSRLFAIDLKNPNARNVDATPQEGRSSTQEVMQQLSAYVDEVLKKTGASKVVLVGNSRGANTIRNYVKNGGGAAKVSHVVLGGGVNHGVVALDNFLVGSEFNGLSPFMQQLNGGPDEVVAGVKFMTIRSDKDDKYAQPDGMFLGIPGKPTNIGFDGPALKGATNIVIAGLDHRETAFSAQAFVPMYKFITGRDPKKSEVTREAKPVLNGVVTGITAGVYDNVPVAGAKVEIYKVDAKTGERQGKALLSKTTGADGVWGPFAAQSNAYYEFVVTAPGQAITHIYRSPFLRGSNYVYLRPGQFTKGDETAGSVVVMSRPRGYFGVGRDRMSLDGKPPAGVNTGVPGASTAKVVLPATPQRTVVAIFRSETIPARNWPVADKHISIAEFTN